MNNDITVKFLEIDRIIAGISTYNTYVNRKISEQILFQNCETNAHLADLKKQMNQANEINRRILQNQIREIERKQELKFYKDFSFKTSEIVEQLEKIEDPMLLKYIIDGFYENTKNSLVVADDALEEISDKFFNKQIFEKLNTIKNKIDVNPVNYSTSVLSKIDNLLLDLKQKENHLNKLRKPEYTERKIIDKWRINPFRNLGILILSILTFMFFVGLFISFGNILEVFKTLFALLLFGIPLFFSLRKEIKWRKEFPQYEASQAQKRNAEKAKKIDMKKQEDEKIQRSLSGHPAFKAMEEIRSKYPTFESVTNFISEIEAKFQKKWGL